MGAPFQARTLTWYSSSAAEEKNTAKSGAGTLFQILISNVSSATVYVYLFQNTAASGTLAMIPIPVPGNGGTASLDSIYGRAFTTGLYFASSSSATTYTATTTADLYVSAGYV